MKKIFFIALLLITTFSSILKGQSSLGIDNSFLSYSYNDTTYFNTPDTFKIKVKNYGPQIFAGAVEIVYAVDSSNTGNGITPVISDSSIVNIPLNGSVGDSSSISIAPNAFRSGINTVVIWPRSASSAFTTHDSLKLSVWVLGYAGIHNLSGKEKTFVFPNPTQNRLYIANKDPDFIIEQVRILDISGQLIYSDFFKGSIDASKLTSGTYTLEFSDKTGKTSRYKVIKE